MKSLPRIRARLMISTSLVELRTRPNRFIRRSLIAASAILLSLVLTLCSSADVALTFTGGFPDTPAPGYTQGWRFHVNEPITVSALGVWDQNADGLLESHQVGIWTLGGTLLTSTTVQANLGSSITAGFRYEMTTPVTLPSGKDYLIGALYTRSQSDERVVRLVASVATEPELNYLA